MDEQVKVETPIAQENAVPQEAVQPVEEKISIDDFFKVKLVVASVVAAEKVEKADKLLKLTLNVAGAEKTVVSGIAQHYTAEEMVGKSVVWVSNLAPRKLRGIMSEGMILCAVDEQGGFAIVSPEKAVLSGGEVC